MFQHQIGCSDLHQGLLIPRMILRLHCCCCCEWRLQQLMPQLLTTPATAVGFLVLVSFTGGIPLWIPLGFEIGTQHVQTASNLLYQQGTGTRVMCHDSCVTSGSSWSLASNLEVLDEQLSESFIDISQGDLIGCEMKSSHRQQRWLRNRPLEQLDLTQNWGQSSMTYAQKLHDVNSLEEKVQCLHETNITITLLSNESHITRSHLHVRQREEWRDECCFVAGAKSRHILWNSDLEPQPCTSMWNNICVLFGNIEIPNLKAARMHLDHYYGTWHNPFWVSQTFKYLPHLSNLLVKELFKIEPYACKRRNQG